MRLLDFICFSTLAIAYIVGYIALCVAFGVGKLPDCNVYVCVPAIVAGLVILGVLPYVAYRYFKYIDDSDKRIWALKFWLVVFFLPIAAIVLLVCAVVKLGRKRKDTTHCTRTSRTRRSDLVINLNDISGPECAAGETVSSVDDDDCVAQAAERSSIVLTVDSPSSEHAASLIYVDSPSSESDSSLIGVDSPPSERAASIIGVDSYSSEHSASRGSIDSLPMVHAPWIAHASSRSGSDMQDIGTVSLGEDDDDDGDGDDDDDYSDIGKAELLRVAEIPGVEETFPEEKEFIKSLIETCQQVHQLNYINVLHVWCIRDSPAKRRYLEMLKFMRPVTCPPQLFAQKPILTTTLDDPGFYEFAGMDPDYEVLLFHGTKVENLESIIMEGLSMRYFQVGIYGRGLYFAENILKSDQYVHDVDDERDTGLVVLLCRVSLGVVREHGSADDVVSADSEVAGLDRPFREFIIEKDEQCLPEYIIVYERLTSSA